jgi:hypothetical protein
MSDHASRHRRVTSAPQSQDIRDRHAHPAADLADLPGRAVGRGKGFVLSLIKV